MNTEIQNIVIIGSGNIAFHLVSAFTMNGLAVVQILARNELTAQQLSTTFNIPYTLNVSDLTKDADLYILAVQDDYIHDLASQLDLTDQLLIHTSGFASLDLLSGGSSAMGVMWPLQTFTWGMEMDYSHIPIFIEGNNRKIQERLMRLALLISDRVIATDSPTRQQVHLAAVIASNLANHLYSLAADILGKNNIPFDVLGPLMSETAAKAGLQHPSKSQTGPAERNDYRVIEKHLELLGDVPEIREIYRLISGSIIHQHFKKDEKL